MRICAITCSCSKTKVTPWMSGLTGTPLIRSAYLRSAVNHDKLAGLQAADAVASSLFYAVQPNRFGEAEDKYASLLRPTYYRNKQTTIGYGLKFWPEDLQKLESANPQLAVFAEGGLK